MEWTVPLIWTPRQDFFPTGLDDPSGARFWILRRTWASCSPAPPGSEPSHREAASQKPPAKKPRPYKQRKPKDFGTSTSQQQLRDDGDGFFAGESGNREFRDRYLRWCACALNRPSVFLAVSRVRKRQSRERPQHVKLQWPSSESGLVLAVPLLAFTALMC